jgi:hypothetical protein
MTKRFEIALLLTLVLPAAPGSLRGAPLFEWRGEGACSAGLGRCTVLVPDPGFCGMNNPSRTTEFPGATLSAATAVPFSVPGLRASSLWFGSGGSGGGSGYGVGYSRFGAPAYLEERASVSLGRRLGSSAAVGVDVSLHRLVIDGMGQRAFVSSSLGFATREDRRIRFGAALRNLFRFGASVRSEVRPSAAVGASLSLPSTGSLVLVEIRRRSLCGDEVSFGLETRLWRTIVLRMGACSDPPLYSIGLSLGLSFLSVDVSVEEHTVLGQTRSIGMTLFPGELFE